MKCCVYIAGPILALNEKGQQLDIQLARNILQAQEASVLVWSNGGVAICPHTNNLGIQGSITREEILIGDLELLRRCDGIVMLKGWTKSAGSVGEEAYAIRYNLEIFDLGQDQYAGSIREAAIQEETERLVKWLKST
jgi:hypothetical protein